MFDWRRVPLGSVASVTVGHVGPMTEHYDNHGVIFLRSQNVKAHSVDLNDVVRITTAFHRALRKSVLTPGDVVTVRTGKPGISAVVPPSIEEANCADLVITRPGPELNARWLSYYMNSAATGYISASLVGAVQQHFNVSAAKSLVLHLPSLPEQRAIAEVLGALDDKISVNNAMEASAVSLARSLFEAAVIKDSWGCTVGEAACLISRGAAPRYVADQDGVLVVNQRCIRGGLVDPSTARRGAAQARSGTWLRYGDVLINSTGMGTLGRVGRWTHEAKATVDSHVTLVRAAEEVHPTCLGFAMLGLEDAFESQAEGSTGQTELSRTAIAKTPLRLPRSSHFVGDQLEALSRKAHAAHEEIGQLARLRDTLLPKLMSGELRVKDAEREIGEVV